MAFLAWFPGADHLKVVGLEGEVDCKTVGFLISSVSLSVFSLVPDLLFDCSRVLEYAITRTVLQSKGEVALRLNCDRSYLHTVHVFYFIFLPWAIDICRSFFRHLPTTIDLVTVFDAILTSRQTTGRPNSRCEKRL